MSGFHYPIGIDPSDPIPGGSGPIAFTVCRRTGKSQTMRDLYEALRQLRANEYPPTSDGRYMILTTPRRPRTSLVLTMNLRPAPKTLIRVIDQVHGEPAESHEWVVPPW